MLKKILINKLRGLKNGFLILRNEEKLYKFGNPKSSLKAEIVIKDDRFYKFLIFGGSIGASEAYMNNYWQSPDLTKVIRVFASNVNLTDELESKFNILIKPFFKLIHYFNKNSIKNSKKNISAHYDLNNDFFKLFLDETMMYSSAIFDKTSQSLKAASINKLKIICNKLDLKKTDHVVEIGSGWGAFAVYAAENYGCKVTTTTISEQQYTFTKALIKQKKLEKKVKLIFKDYRKLNGKFDKLVSIEMIEAVGHQYYPEYFKKINSLLTDNGLALIQAITIRDQKYIQATKSVDFIQKYIFPGSCIPSIEAIQSNVSKTSALIISDLENINHHYAVTLSHWAKRFKKNESKIKKLGFDDRFLKKWEFYFSYCEGGFSERAINDFHILLSMPLNRSPQNNRDIFVK
jgi:cyclopropane-fatty-acyl-phospholipid synthase